MRVQKRLQEAVVEVISPLLTEFCEEEVTAKLGRGKRVPRRVSEHVREIDWYCRHCGCRDANQFRRDGHSRRALETGWGHVDGLQVPMLECQRCGHDVVCTYAILEKYRRGLRWMRDQHVLFGSGFCQSLRQLSQEWGAKLDRNGGLRTMNERINQIEPLLQHAHTDPITDVPAVVQFDGIWLRLPASDGDHQARQTPAQAPSAQGQEGGAPRRSGLLERWQWQTGDCRLLGS